MQFLLRTVAALICVASATNAQTCPNEWTSFDGSCYTIGTETLNWADAEEICRIFESDLVVIETQREMDFIKRLLAEHHPTARVWLGATDVFNEGTFMWIRTFQPVAYSNWLSGQPDHLTGSNSEDCVSMRGDHQWQWSDEKCQQNNYFLCEISLGVVGGGVIG